MTTLYSPLTEPWPRNRETIDVSSFLLPPSRPFVYQFLQPVHSKLASFPPSVSGMELAGNATTRAQLTRQRRQAVRSSRANLSIRERFRPVEHRNGWNIQESGGNRGKKSTEQGLFFSSRDACGWPISLQPTRPFRLDVDIILGSWYWTKSQRFLYTFCPSNLSLCDSRGRARLFSMISLDRDLYWIWSNNFWKIKQQVSEKYISINFARIIFTHVLYRIKFDSFKSYNRFRFKEQREREREREWRAEDRVTESFRHWVWNTQRCFHAHAILSEWSSAESVQCIRFVTHVAILKFAHWPIRLTR